MILAIAIFCFEHLRSRMRRETAGAQNDGDIGDVRRNPFIKNARLFALVADALREIVRQRLNSRGNIRFIADAICVRTRNTFETGK